MKWITMACITLVCLNLQAQPVDIIFDTDIAPDYDDVGALAILHAFADKGECRILATISSNAFGTTVPTLSVINSYFGRPSIPVGIVQGNFPNMACGQEWAQAIIKDYPKRLSRNDQAENAVTLYRKILAGSADTSVTIVTVGFFTNLAALMESRADNYSSLDGLALITKKVKQLVSMAARIDSGKNGGYEFNVFTDSAAARKVFAGWPRPMTISGFEIGEKIHTGIRLIADSAIRHDPVKDAFRIALTRDGNTVGRSSWDETAVWVAVRGIAPLFKYRRLNLKILEDGRDEIIPGNRFIYLEFNESPGQIAARLEELMMHQPAIAK